MTIQCAGGRRFTIPALLALTLVLAGCAGLTGEPRDQTDRDDAANRSGDSPQQLSAQDPVARYVLSARPGDTATLSLQDGRQVRVTVGKTYHSAADVRCRRITLQTERESSRVSAVCRQNDGWRTVLDP